MVFKTNFSLKKTYHSEENDSDDYVEYKHSSCRPKSCRRFGYIFALAGMAFLCIMSIGQLSCKRSENVCLFQERHFWESEFRTKTKIAISDIKYAFVDEREHCDKDGCSTSYYVKMKTNFGDREPFHSSGGHQAAREKVAKINNFLKMELGEDLVITENALWFLFPLAFALVGLLLIWIPYYMKKKASKEQNPIVER